MILIKVKTNLLFQKYWVLRKIASITVNLADIANITNIPHNESFVFGGSLTGGYPLLQAAREALFGSLRDWLRLR